MLIGWDLRVWVVGFGSLCVWIDFGLFDWCVDYANCFDLICGLSDGFPFDLRSLYCLLMFGIELPGVICLLV